MTRKRFIKLAMSYGIQRNEAENLALEVKTAGSYNRLYERNRLLFSMTAIGTAFGKTTKTVAIAMGKAYQKMFAKPVLTEIKNQRRTADNDNG